ncbi:alkaline ceramidase [Oratosquilla oratoria]|uniref:alkaline ceramidase n=1 Tax=Oratosquilla oratoria TaxID=337810 RepID=UPI003F770952
MRRTTTMADVWLQSGTSPVDWCEVNYSVTPHVAEFVNTVSNVLFLVVPLVYARLWANYARRITRGIHLVWVFFVIVGASSAYFHATLSLLGQLLDELSILWLLMVAYSLFTPMRYRVMILGRQNRVFPLLVGLSAVAVTALAFKEPKVNAYLLFLFGSPGIYMLFCEVSRTKIRLVKRLGWNTLIIFFAAVAVWVSDRFMCHLWRRLNLAVLHGLWHIFIFISAYNMQALFCYFRAFQDMPETQPQLQCWPRKIGFPYVRCKPFPAD